MHKQKFKSPLALAFIVVILAFYGSYHLIAPIFTNQIASRLTEKADSLYASYTPIPVVKRVQKNRFSPRFMRKIDLNRADTSELMKIYGIGRVLSSRIVDYRERLGGYVRVEQLLEVSGINKSLFSSISPIFLVDTSCISQIFINFAPQSIATHPYGGRSVHKRITNYLNSEGGIFKLKELSYKNILLPSEANSLAPYLRFDSVTSSDTLHKIINTK